MEGSGYSMLVDGYKQKDQNVPHGLMFHHFFDKKHVRGQGSISEHQFEKIIQHYGKNILSADNWFNKAKSNSLDDKDVCLTFDDTLLCQYDIALPVLQKYNLTAFWFINSSVLTGEIGNLEVYRKFRTVCFSGIEDFYGHIIGLHSHTHPTMLSKLSKIDQEKEYLKM